jgi:hypothetical protein
MKAFTGLLAGAIALAWGGVALAQAAGDCPQPLPQPLESLRPAPVGDPPVTPACINLQTRVSTCPKRQLDHFNQAIDAYNTQVSAWNLASSHYVNALNDWTNSVSIYSLCEVQKLNRNRPGH